MKFTYFMEVKPGTLSSQTVKHSLNNEFFPKSYSGSLWNDYGRCLVIQQVTVGG